MHISFNPPLGEATSLITALCPDDQLAPTEELLFRASFESQTSYEQAQKDGVRVEIWTDLPVQGCAAEEWNAIVFKTLQDFKSDVDDNGQKTFTLFPDVEQDASVGKKQENSMYAKVPVQLQGYSSGHHFSFTYRMVYPSGDVQWLGEYGRNGALVVEHKSTMATLGVNLSEEWVNDPAGKAELTGRNGEEEVVGTLNQSLEWSSWAIRDDSLPIFSTSVETPLSHLIVLVPSMRSHTLVIPRTIALYATGGASVRVSAQGEIRYTSKFDDGHASVAPVDAVSPSSLEECHLTCYTISQQGVQSPCAVFMSTRFFPSSLLVIPSQPLFGHHPIEMKTEDLLSHMPGVTTESLIMSLPSSHSFCALSQNETVVLHSSPYGGTANISPTYIVMTDGTASSSWKICLLDSYENAMVNEATELNDGQRLLPTPPPSPPMAPRPLQRPPALPISSPSDASETTVDSSAPTSLPTPISPSSSTHDESPTPSPPTAPQTSSRDSDALALVRSPHSLEIYMRSCLLMFAWLWRSVFQRLAFVWLGAVGTRTSNFGNGAHIHMQPKSDEPERDRADDNGEPAAEPGSKGSGVSVDGADVRGDTSTDDTSTAADASMEMSSQQPSLISGFKRQVVLESEFKQPGAEQTKPEVEQAKFVAEQTVPMAEQLKRLPQALSADIHARSGKFALLVQVPSGFVVSPTTIRFTLNGNPITDPEIVATKDEGYSLVRLAMPSGLESGKLHIIFNA
ncbi:uncharacterized protein LAESUDRAFT_812934 [Laetiporus sulphureus 93-53]|uniref:Uncharacterized protein n=1 Tax=Laetiporus sulphureus 93-53 TaxID=1314785 RepID=A0A165E6V0_9APHY|nr:uncharacterized protein LAESUDRAFT_812934 [Laetiporus sulphureus 93-53]KZT06352.1 hypothetical protein LAESUDRAFT_812934 [Laetiporus sulphureus 93-53]